jgi:DNA-binding transcriptional LysR family regulator
MHVTLRQLRVFERVAQHLSLTRAAEELHLTQPAVSMQLRQLEDQVGLRLVEQFGRKLQLTEAGVDLLQHARRVQAEVDELVAAMKARRGLQRGRVRLAVVSTANYFIPAVIAAFRRRHPAIGVELSVGNREQVFRQLADNAVDLTVAGQPPDQFDCEAERVMDNPLVVIAAPDHALVGRRRIGLAELAMHPLVLREPGSGTRAAFLRLLAEQGIDVRVACELPSVEAVKQAVQAGLGVGVVSQQSVELEVAAGRLNVLPVTGFPMLRQWFVMHRSGKPLSLAAEAFRRCLVEVCAAG